MWRAVTQRPPYHSSRRWESKTMENIIVIVVIVLIVLFVLGYFGRGRFSR
jgi:hypothetical protein